MEVFAAVAPYGEVLTQAYQTSNVFLPSVIVGWGAFLAHKVMSNNLPRECPIRIPAARIHEWNSPSLTNRTFFDELSFIENSHWHWANLTCQAPALELIAKSIDTWGSDIVESAPPNLIHRVTESWKRGRAAHPYGNLRSSDLILPPARGMLLVGPEGAGKRHIAQGLAALLFDHCWEPSEEEDSSERNRQPVLLILADDHVHWSNDDGLDNLHPVTKEIVDHVKVHEGLGSVVIVHHIEHLPDSIFEVLSEVMSGKSNNLSYDSFGEKVEAVCDGTLFIFTSKRLGTRRMMQEIQDSAGIDDLDYDSLVSSIRREVEKLSGRKFIDSLSSVIPLLLPQQEDLFSIMRHIIDKLDNFHRGMHWKQLEISDEVIKSLLNGDHIQFYDFKRKDGDEVLFRFPPDGAHALHQHSMFQFISSKLIDGSHREPDKIARIDYDRERNKLVFKWCSDDHSKPCKKVFSSP
mmetsp:Transcript_24561/g.47554  ORF Transcript_24561/g.47554 Transcript_24561/m.47554 type:complete len:463 (+) Transcript_24561:367-1755(+)